MRPAPIAVFFALLGGCGGGGNDTPPDTAAPAPPNAAALKAKVEALGIKHVRKIVVLESSVVAVLVPGSSLAQSVTLAPAAGIHRYTLAGRYDGNLDGQAESQLSGTANFAADPDSDWNGVEGTLSARVDLLNLMHVYQADVAYRIGSDERRFSGTSTYAEPAGDTTTMSVAAASPLVVRAPSAGAPANVCGYNVSGEMAVAIEGVLGRYAAIWRFLAGQSAVVVAGATYRDAGGQVSSMPDGTIDLRCGTDIADWVGTFELQWSCLPRESGTWRMRFGVRDANTLTITDADDGDTFEAQIVGASAHALKGFFIAGPAGARYREDFVWTLAGHRNEFTQVTKYVFQEGAQAGRGGICIGRAKRVS